MRLGLGVGLGGRQTGVGVREGGGARARDGTCRHDGGPAARAAEPALQLAREQELRQFAWAGNDAPPSARDDHGACVWSYCAHVCGATARAAACACSLVGSPVGRPCIAGSVWRSSPFVWAVAAVIVRAVAVDSIVWAAATLLAVVIVWAVVAFSVWAAATLPTQQRLLWWYAKQSNGVVQLRGVRGVGRGARGAGCSVRGAGCGVQGAEVQGEGAGVHDAGVQGAGCMVRGVQRSGQGAGRTCRRRGGWRAAGRRAVWSRWAGSPRP